ncbi:hypothetical protein ABT56_17330 [Photobacterium aquae]|uniref:N-acetyltransferase domain-containing protein n=1 Tax=Photobacterium aquae TaxID=1195763 RepID=A0A0J1GW49_9GAMM|nr:GNAT family N-acetyltransferase [Photobacterium aquae]KLV03841.1 hypothetical protein ABT56_17330 [Photobacterium aquae]
MPNQDIEIRQMKADEKKAMKAVMNIAFPFLMRLFFSFSNNTLVAVKNGEIVGGVILKIFGLPRGLTAGLVSLIFCSPAYSGQGIGKALTAEALDHLKQQGCTDIFACVEGDNTQSSQLFAAQGFVRQNLFAQFRRYGMATLVIWLRSFHLFDIGHFMWVKSLRVPSAKMAQPHSATRSNLRPEFVMTLLFHVAIYAFLLWQYGSGEPEYPFVLLASILSIGILFTVCLGAMYVVALRRQLPCEFRMWESGLTLSGMVALLFGGFVVSPGSLYPAAEKWFYRDVKKTCGEMALVASLALLVLVWGIGLVIHSGVITQDMLPIAKAVWFAGLGLLFLDVLLPFFPFSSFNGRRLWCWNKAVWGSVAICTVPLYVSRLF